MNCNSEFAFRAVIHGVTKSQTRLSDSHKLKKNTRNVQICSISFVIFVLRKESQEELKSLLIIVKEESEKVGLKLNILKTKITASGPITS